MVLLLDLSIVLIFGLTLFFVIKKGFIKSLLELLSVVCAVVMAKMFSVPVSKFLYNILHGFISPKVETAVNDVLQKGNLPELLNNQSLSEILSKYGLNFIETEETAAFISKSLTAMLSYLLAYLVIFVAVMIAFKFITPFVCAIFKLPLLRTANKILSVLLGVVMAALYLLLFVSLMQILVPYICSVYPDVLNSDIIEKTYIFDYLYSLEWLKFFL